MHCLRSTRHAPTMWAWCLQLPDQLRILAPALCLNHQRPLPASAPSLPSASGQTDLLWGLQLVLSSSGCPASPTIPKEEEPAKDPYSCLPRLLAGTGILWLHTARSPPGPAGQSMQTAPQSIRPLAGQSHPFQPLSLCHLPEVPCALCRRLFHCLLPGGGAMPNTH